MPHVMYLWFIVAGKFLRQGEWMNRVLNEATVAATTTTTTSSSLAIYNSARMSIIMPVSLRVRFALLKPLPSTT
jgi:hypothetical protein